MEGTAQRTRVGSLGLQCRPGERGPAPDTQAASSFAHWHPPALLSVPGEMGPVQQGRSALLSRPCCSEHRVDVLRSNGDTPPPQVGEGAGQQVGRIRCPHSRPWAGSGGLAHSQKRKLVLGMRCCLRCPDFSGCCLLLCCPLSSCPAQGLQRQSCGAPARSLLTASPISLQVWSGSHLLAPLRTLKRQVLLAFYL